MGLPKILLTFRVAKNLIEIKWSLGFAVSKWMGYLLLKFK